MTHAEPGIARRDGRELPSASSRELRERLATRRADTAGHVPSEARPDVRTSAPIPTSVREIAALLDTSFFATLLTEEGLPTRFACAYLPPSEDGVSVRRLASPLPFTPESIRRIAQAADPDLTCLGVWGAGDQLCIWGLVDAPRLVCLQVFALDTGVLRVTYLRQTQMTYARGLGRVRTKADPSFMTSIQFVGAALGLVAPQWYRPRALLGLADAIVRTGRGGCVLVTRRPREEVRRGHIEVTFPTDEPLTTLEDAGLESAVASPAASPHAKLLQEFDSRDRTENIRRTARLGAVDGAILLDAHLRIAGFGAMIDVRGVRRGGRAFAIDQMAAAPDLPDVPPPLSALRTRFEVALAELGGQRHQSAARWCSTSRSALLAIVCSQDGPASLVAPAAGGDVVIIPNIETSPENW